VCGIDKQRYNNNKSYIQHINQINEQRATNISSSSTNFLLLFSNCSLCNSKWNICWHSLNYYLYCLCRVVSWRIYLLRSLSYWGLCFAQVTGFKTHYCYSLLIFYYLFHFEIYLYARTTCFTHRWLKYFDESAVSFVALHFQLHIWGLSQAER